MFISCFCDFVKAEDNLLPLDSSHWGVYESYPSPSYPVLYNNHIDTSVLFNGEPTLRIDPHTGADTNTARESDGLFLMCPAGSLVVFSCWIRTLTGEGTTWYPQHGCGGRIGVDFYGSTYLTGIAYAGEYAYPMDEDDWAANAANWVCDSLGGTWQYRELSFVMPSQCHNDAYPYDEPVMGEPYGVIPWMQASPVEVGDETQTAVWFADPQFRIYEAGTYPTPTATVEPTATPTGTPYPTPTGVSTPHPTQFSSYVPSPTVAANNGGMGGFVLLFVVVGAVVVVGLSLMRFLEGSPNKPVGVLFIMCGVVVFVVLLFAIGVL